MKRNNKGFSLIELSIVLIILGLLVAGVTGGASLIKSAQLRSIVTEFTNYRTAYNSYYAQFGKVPGADTDPSIIKDDEAALTDLFEEGVIDKSPIEGTSSENYISSKFGKNAKWFLNNAGASFAAVADFSNANILSLSGSVDYATGALTSDEAENIDTKIDDGIATSGIVRGVKYDSAAAETEYAEENTTRNYSLVSKMDF